MKNNIHGKRYSNDEKNEIMKYLDDHTYKETSDNFKISEPTLARWKKSLTHSVSEQKSKIIISIPQFWLDIMNEKIALDIWEDYNDAFIQLLKTYFTKEKSRIAQKKEKEIIENIAHYVEDFLKVNNNIEGITVSDENKSLYKSEKWPSPDIKHFLKCHSIKKNKEGGNITQKIPFNNEEYMILQQAGKEYQLFACTKHSSNNPSYMSVIRKVISNKEIWFLMLTYSKQPWEKIRNFQRFVDGIKYSRNNGGDTKMSKINSVIRKEFNKRKTQNQNYKNMGVTISYFDRKKGPLMYITYPKDILSKDKEDYIVNLLDQSYKTELFTKKYKELYCLNTYFEVPSKWTRGNKEMLMLTVVVNYAPTFNNEILIRSSSEDFVNKLITEKNMYQAFHKKEEEIIEDSEDEREKYYKILKNWVQDLYNSVNEKVKI